MMNPMIKTGLAGLLGLAATGAWADAPFTLSDSDGATVVHGIANAGITISFDAPFTVFSAQLEMQWTPDALSLQASQVSLNGVSGAALTALLDPGFGDLVVLPALGDGATVNAAPLVPLVLSGSVPVGLGLQGLAVGIHTVQYTLRLADTEFNEFELSDSFLVTVSAVPEPASWALLLGGLLGVAALAQRRSRAD